MRVTKWIGTIYGYHKQTVTLAFLFAAGACATHTSQVVPVTAPPAIGPAHAATIAERFAYPIGPAETATEARDSDDWYNALDFGVEAHLGEDWNKNSGGNSDCGESVYSAANGTITFAGDAGPGWGNIVIVEHSLPSGDRVQTLYGHLQEIVKSSGEIRTRELIGRIGNANGRYLCHLHFELRTLDCPMWNKAGPGYSSDNSGWLDPSDFIDGHRAKGGR